jgi:CheY-like chemotaxis protein
LVVLIVDDDTDALDLLVRVLQNRNAQVVRAESAAEALEVLQRSRPHVMVSDINMPDEDGFSLMLRVRALPAEQGGFTPAIALTALNQESDRRRALSAGFWRHLPKPVDANLLCAEVSRLGRSNDSTRV